MTPAKTSPTRSAGRCSPRGGALATPALYPATFSTPRFTPPCWSGTPSVQNPAPQGASRLSVLGGAGTPPQFVGGDTVAHSAKQGRSLVSGPAVVGVGLEHRQLSGAGDVEFRDERRRGRLRWWRGRPILMDRLRILVSSADSDLRPAVVRLPTLSPAQSGVPRAHPPVLSGGLQRSGNLRRGRWRSGAYPPARPSP